MGLLENGDDAAVGQAYPYQDFNNIKNNWQRAAPQVNVNLTTPQPGMIVSDSDDNRLWHKLVAAGFEELLQAGGVVTYENEVVCFEGEIVTCGI